MCLFMYIYIYVHACRHVGTYMNTRVCTHTHTYSHRKRICMYMYVRCMLMILNKLSRKVAYLGTRYYYKQIPNNLPKVLFQSCNLPTT